MNFKKIIMMPIKLREVVVPVLVVIVSAALNIPSYKNYSRTAYYSDVVKAATPYAVAVDNCYKKRGTLMGCDAGKHNIPAPITSARGAVASLSVTSGMIVVTPLALHGIELTDMYILTPSVKKHTLIWNSSGNGVKHGYSNESFKPHKK